MYKLEEKLRLKKFKYFILSSLTLHTVKTMELEQM